MSHKISKVDLSYFSSEKYSTLLDFKAEDAASLEDGISIMNYFDSIIGQLYHKKNVEIEIEADGHTLRLYVRKTFADVEIIEKTLGRPGTNWS